jgi:glycosyltransferase involved in cell wall biosynthesis
MPVLWWIHEANEWYKPTIEEYEEMAQKELFSDMNIMAVSSIAKNNFNQYFDNTIKNILAYGIPDLYRHESVCNYKKNKMIFAIVGVVTYRKAQDIFVDAIDILQKRNKISNTEFWIIGAIEDNQFCRKIIESSKKGHNIIIKGQMTRIEIQEAFKKIDVVVCPSREDPLPIVMTEGMMYGKVCIASDETGTFDFIEEKVNGLVCESENSISLADAMEWVIDNRDKCSNIGVNARKTYEDYFTMENFGDRLNRAIDITLTKLRSR